MNVSYIGSLVFAAVAFILIGAQAIMQGDVWTFRLVVIAAVFAWISCYVGAVAEEGENVDWLWFASLCFTVIAMLVGLIAVLRALA